MKTTRQESQERIDFYNKWCDEIGIKGTSSGYVNFCKRVDKLESRL